MQLPLLTLLFSLGLVTSIKGQANEDQEPETLVWTEEDREYLLDNLIQSKEELIKETQHLTEEQWNFKEEPDRWNINQIVEHLAIYELIFMDQISVALQMGEFPQIKSIQPIAFSSVTILTRTKQRILLSHSPTQNHSGITKEVIT